LIYQRFSISIYGRFKDALYILAALTKNDKGGRDMGRILGVVVVVVGLFIAQSGYDFYLSRYYTEVEATLIAYEEDCYVEKGAGNISYFDCRLAATMTDAGGASDSKIERHAKLTYQYRVPSESDFREARTQTWAVQVGKFWVGQKRKISVKNDDPTKVLWSRLVV
jgi:hypothetical protein